MGLLSRFKPGAKPGVDEAAHETSGTGRNPPLPDQDMEKMDDSPPHVWNIRVIFMILVVSIGGMIFGYDTGQISGFLEMKDFLDRFGENGSFTDVRSGTITGLLSIGTLVGVIVAAPIANTFGRRVGIIWGNVLFWIGVIVQMTATYTWYQVALGRWVAGLGVGALSVMTPMYMSETGPRQIRGSMVSCYQLFITLGILVADCINYGTEADDSARSWRIPMGIGYVWSVIMAVGICFLPESPRWDYRRGNIERARKTISSVYGVEQNHYEVNREIREIKAKLEVEQAGGNHPWYEVFTGPRMLYRVILGFTLQMFQQLTGANFFFYYGTTIFTATGLSNSYETAIILGAVNFFCTFGGLYVVEHFGRRKALIVGGVWMFAMFMVFASIGHFVLNQTDPTQTPGAGSAMIVFACLFIAGYAMTWAPIIWCVVGELYPSRYRAMAMGIATTGNWSWNFLIAFFTPFITKAIDYRYGYVFAACNATGAVIAYFFLCEHQGRTLEEIDTMYILHVVPWKSTNWQPPEGEDLVTTDALTLGPGARTIRKADAAGMESENRVEQVPPANAQHGITDVTGTNYDPAARPAHGRRGMSVAEEKDEPTHMN